ncbi:hypothetical protein [Lacrimispora sp.]|uniref:hypothetical protein n=1 Tax=Lacrimispora sp. TaxID=2719234 RepID=UPI0029E3F4D8|nr:hypothetical protein [Lacrimispora sp.]
MMNNKKAIAAIAAGLLVVCAIVFLTVESAGGTFDVVGKRSIQSFEQVLKAIPEQVSQESEGKDFTLTAPDGSVRFIWNSANNSDSRFDVMLQADAAPFVAAGLDTGKLPEEYDVSGDFITAGLKLDNSSSVKEGKSALDAYESMVYNDRSLINYHMDMDHFGVKLGGGNMFEWAKNMKTSAATGKDQDKDIVFVLNPEPFIAAGVNPEKVEGWVFAPVPVMENGKKTEVLKFLKPFNIQ